MKNVSVNLTDFKINITDPYGNSSLFNFTWDISSYKKSFIFTEEGDYPFVIYAIYPYDDIPEIAGTLKVRNPYYITFEGFETKNKQVTPYDNDFAYIIAELTEKPYYDRNLEQFIVPMLFSQTYNTSVFYAPYIDGVATLKLWERNTNYAVRMIDGQILFNGIYSVPNITDSYGTNTFIDKYYFNGSNKTIQVYLDEKDLYQYRWLANWIFIILLVFIIAGSVFLFFVIPEYSQLSIIFGLGFISMLTLLRIVVWFWKGV